jgi:MFS family permease
MEARVRSVPAGDVSPADYRTVVTGLAIGQIVSWAILYYGFSSFVLPMLRELAWPKATLMGAFTLGLLVCGIGNYAVGVGIDRGQGRWIMTVGALLGGLCCALWAMVSSPWMLYVAFAIGGVAMAMTLYDPAFSLLTKRFPTRYRDGITTLTLVGGFASTLSFPAIAALVNGLGWRGTLWVLAAVLALFVAPLHALALRGTAVAASPRAHDEQADATLHGALRTPAFWYLMVALTLFAFGASALWSHLMPAFQSKGLSEAQALAVVVWIGPAQVAGRFAYAWFGRTFTLYRLGQFVMLGLPMALALFAWSTTVAPMLLFALLFGTVNGLVTLVRGGLMPEYFGRAHIGRIGGLLSGVSLVARAAAPLGAATALLVLPGYTAVMLVFALLGLVALLAFCLAGPPLRESGKGRGQEPA